MREMRNIYLKNQLHMGRKVQENNGKVNANEQNKE